VNKLSPSFFLAYRSVSRGSKITVALIVLVITLAFVNLVFISSILNGMLAAIDDQVKTNYVSNIVIEPQQEPKAKTYIKNTNVIQRQIESLDGVVATTVHYKLSGTVAFDKEKRGNYVYQSPLIVGIEPEKEKYISEIPGKIIDGSYLSSPGKNDIILGVDLAGGYKEIDDPNSLAGAKIGDKLRIVFGNGVERIYRVRGIFQTNFAPIDAMAFVTDREAESVLGVSRSASQILVKVDNPASEDKCLQQIKSIVPDLVVRKWTDYIGVIGDLSTSFNMIGAVVSVIGLVVAAITIFMLIYINIRHKRRQIGIMKAIGIPHDIIIYSYIVQTSFYWICGTIIGVLLIVYVIAPYFSMNPLETPIGNTGLSISSNSIILNIVCLFIAVIIGGLLPAWRGSRVNILKAIWGN
jgi:putative ABC transport system permease protein